MSELEKVRINKVLRELNISLKEAVEFLKSKGQEIKKRPTTKIILEQYLLLYKEFSSDKSNKFKTDEEIKRVFSKELQIWNQNKRKQSTIKDLGLNNPKELKIEKKLKLEGRTIKLHELLSKKSKAKNLLVKKNDDIKKNKKKKENKIMPKNKYPNGYIPKIDHYTFTKLKRIFLIKDCNLTELCDYYFVKESWVLSKLLTQFPDVKMSDRVTLQHLTYIYENFYDTLKECKKYSETIDTKNPKTKPNYFKLIYTR